MLSYLWIILQEIKICDIIIMCDYGIAQTAGHVVITMQWEVSFCPANYFRKVLRIFGLGLKTKALWALT